MTAATVLPSTYALGGDRIVTRLGFGAMRLAAGTFTGPPRDPETGIRVLRQAVEAGVDHIDTAAFYERGGVRANELIRRALTPTSDVVVATKVGPMRDASGALSSEAGPDELRGLVEENLRELRRDQLDLVYLRVGGLHAPDGRSIGARFQVLADLRQQGLIRRVGVSNVDSAQLAEARAIAPVAAVQNRFGIHDRDALGLLAECEAAGIAFVPFFSLIGEPTPALAAVAARHEATSHQIALAWTLQLAPNVLAIPGTGDAAHLTANMAAGRIRLTADDLDELDGL